MAGLCKDEGDSAKSKSKLSASVAEYLRSCGEEESTCSSGTNDIKYFLDVDREIEVA